MTHPGIPRMPNVTFHGNLTPISVWQFVSVSCQPSHWHNNCKVYDFSHNTCLMSNNTDNKYKKQMLLIISFLYNFFAAWAEQISLRSFIFFWWRNAPWCLTFLLRTHWHGNATCTVKSAAKLTFYFFFLSEK